MMKPLRRTDKLRNVAHSHDLMKCYFMLDLRCGECALLLSMVDDIVISMPKLRRKNESYPLEMATFVVDQLEGL